MNARLQGLNRFRSLGVDTVWMMAQDGLMVLVSLLSFTLIVHAFGPGEYGAYIGAYGIIAPLTGLAWNGVALTVLQRARQEGRDPSEVARNGFSMTFIVGSFSSVLAVTLANLLVPSLTVPEIIFLVVSELVGTAPIALSGALLQSTDGIPAAAKVRITMGLLRATVLVALFATGNLTILSLGITVSIVFVSYAAWLITVRLPRSGVHVRLGRPSADYAKTAFAFAVPIVAASVQMDSDKTALNFYGHEKTAGLYGAAFRLVQFAALPINSVEGVAFHRFLDSDADERGQQVRRAAKSGAVTFTLSILAAGAMYFLAPLLIHIAGDQFGGSVTMVRWLLLWLPVYALSTAPINGLMGLGRLGVRAAVLIASGIVSVACYIAFVPTLTWRGGLIGTIAGEMFVVVVGWIALVHYQRVHDRSLTAPNTSSLEEVPA